MVRMEQVDTPTPRHLYTVSEVAHALRISSETVRRKIAQGELRAVEISQTPRKQYRILSRDLSLWLGEEQARAVFGVGEALVTLRSVFAQLEDDDRTALLEEAKVWARAQTPERGRVGRTVSVEAIAERFADR